MNSKRVHKKYTKIPFVQIIFTWLLARFKNSFSHPDFTVGSGVSPDPPLGYQTVRVTDLEVRHFITAGWEFHPTPKEIHLW